VEISGHCQKASNYFFNGHSDSEPYQQELLRTRLEIQQETLKNIHYEIYDHIGQQLSLSKLHLGTLEGHVDEVVSKKILEAKELISQSILELRELCRESTEDTIRGTGLISALELLLKRCIRRTRVHAELTVAPGFREPGKEQTLILYGMFQEVLSNSMQHARATKISIEFTSDGQRWRACIRDNGTGYDKEQEHQSGSGLQNLFKRARMIGADLYIDTKPGLGTAVYLTLPNKKMSHDKSRFDR
jgi:two-component system, NarL family, sensor kinase